jgi:hypothetical protein
MAAKERNALSSHPAFYPAAAKRFSQVDQIHHYHIFRKILRIFI